MAYCPKCGSKTDEEMAFCPKCGAPLKVEQIPSSTARTARYRNEKEEKSEKHEKNEKTEKREKREHALIGPLIGGLILIFLGLASYLEMTHVIEAKALWAYFLVIIGIVIIVGAIYGALLTTRRHPRT